MVQSHDPPSPESGRDKRYYEHVMKDFHEQYDSVGQTSQYRDSRMKTHQHLQLFFARKLQHFQSPQHWHINIKVNIQGCITGKK
jgi:hypothetical protein